MLNAFYFAWKPGNLVRSLTLKNPARKILLSRVMYSVAPMPCLLTDLSVTIQRWSSELGRFISLLSRSLLCAAELLIPRSSFPGVYQVSFHRNTNRLLALTRSQLGYVPLIRDKWILLDQFLNQAFPYSTPVYTRMPLYGVMVPQYFMDGLDREFW